MTYSIELTAKITQGLVRQQVHATVSGCRAVVEYRDQIYEVVVTPIADVPKRMKDVWMDEQQEQVAPDGSV